MLRARIKAPTPFGPGLLAVAQALSTWIFVGCHSFDERSICDDDAQASERCPGYRSTADVGDALDSQPDDGDTEADAQEHCSIVGNLRCQGRKIERCIDDGTWQEYDSCPVACNDGACITAVDLATTTTETDCAIMSDGSVWCWGTNDAGQIGDGTKLSRVNPVMIPELRNAKRIALGEHGCALMADDGVACWGANDHGQLGDGSMQEHLRPTRLPKSPSARELTASWFTCALLVGQGAMCWGDGHIFGSSTDVTEPTLVQSFPASADSIAANRYGACALSATHVYCWGVQVQNAPGSSTYPPAQVPGSFVAMYGGTATVYGFGSDGVASCWGDCPTAGGGVATTWPPLERPEWAGASSLAVGGEHTCGVFAPGFVKCAGANSWGQLGNGTNADSIGKSVDVLDLPRVTKLISGGAHSCAITAAGQLYCWGHTPIKAGFPNVLKPEPVLF